MRIVVLFCLVSLTVEAQENINQARKSLSSAIAEVDVDDTRNAVRSLQMIGNRQAVDALAKSLGFLSKRNRILLAEEEKYLREIGKISSRSRGKIPPGSRLEDLYVKVYQVEEKMRHLSEIRTLLASSFDQLDQAVVLKSLLRKWKKKGDANGRADMAEWLGESGLAEARDALLKKLKKEKEPLVRKAILDGFSAARQKEECVIEAASEYLEDPCWQFSLSAVQLLVSSRSPGAVLPLIRFLKPARGRMREEANRALYRLTGVDKHGNHATWMAWWEENGEAVLNGEWKKPSRRRSGGGEKNVTSFYGIPLQSDKVVFVVDASKSMAAPSGWVPPKDVPTGRGRGEETKLRLEEETRIGVARYELKRALTLLPNGAHFNIIFFHQAVWAFRSDGMETLTPVTRRLAFRFIDEVELALGTDIYSAMKRSFEFSGVLGAENRVRESDADTIFFISDGFSFLQESLQDYGVMRPMDILAAVKTWNRGPRVILHSIAILDESGKGGKRFLTRLAGNHSGTYVER